MKRLAAIATLSGLLLLTRTTLTDPRSLRGKPENQQRQGNLPSDTTVEVDRVLQQSRTRPSEEPLPTLGQSGREGGHQKRHGCNLDTVGQKLEGRKLELPENGERNQLLQRPGRSVLEVGAHHHRKLRGRIPKELRIVDLLRQGLHTRRRELHHRCLLRESQQDTSKDIDRRPLHRNQERQQLRRQAEARVLLTPPRECGGIPSHRERLMPRVCPRNRSLSGTSGPRFGYLSPPNVCNSVLRRRLLALSRAE